jgi:predicted RNA binding protein YcfA (HicA-like mRNA interferase family)
MKPRKVKDLQKTLLKKGFVVYPEKEHHQFYYLTIDEIKYPIYTYFSHGKKEYDKNLMSKIKKQLKFPAPEQAEDFFDCPMSAKQYVEMLVETEVITLP